MMPSRGDHARRARAQTRAWHCVRSMGERRRRPPRPAACFLVRAAACLLLAALLPALAASQPVNLPNSETDWSGEDEEAPLPPDRYFANDSLLEQPVHCTDEEKECLRYNRLLLPSYGRCFALGEKVGPCRIAVDRCLWEHKGRLRAECAPTDLCRPLNAYKVRMAFDGRCLKTREVLGACGPGAVNLVPHFFGGWECARAVGVAPPPPPRYVPQPARRGRCAFPNLRHDRTSVINEERRALFKACSQQQSVCFARKQVWLAETRSCGALLGPCAPGRWLVVNRTAWQEGRVEGECAAVRPCGPDARLMAFDRACHEKDVVLRALCPGGALLPNAFGEMSCVTSDYYRHVIDLTSTRPEACEITQSVSFSADAVAANLVPDCDLNEGGRCEF